MVLTFPSLALGVLLPAFLGSSMAPRQSTHTGSFARDWGNMAPVLSISHLKRPPRSTA